MKELSIKYSETFRGHNNIQGVQPNRAMQYNAADSNTVYLDTIDKFGDNMKKKIIIFLDAFIPVSLVAHAV